MGKTESLILNHLEKKELLIIPLVLTGVFAIGMFAAVSNNQNFLSLAVVLSAGAIGFSFGHTRNLFIPIIIMGVYNFTILGLTGNSGDLGRSIILIFVQSLAIVGLTLGLDKVLNQKQKDLELLGIVSGIIFGIILVLVKI